jgi:DNA-binding NtrC family response regulator
VADVLIVDDDDSMRRTIRRILSSTGCRIHQANSGNAAADAMQQQRFSLVLTDLHMPQGDGFFVLRAAREQHPQMPVVMLSGSGDAKDSIAALREGAVNFVTKPFHSRDLLAVVESCIDTQVGDPTRKLAGLITERHFALAEEEFPGISRFYAECAHKPATFLDLVQAFEHRA